jgi:uncharacterized protein involved in type VI secretion and phage assembly
MTDERKLTAGNRNDVSEVPREEWPRWCAEATSEYSGRQVELRQADRAIGEVSLAEGQRLVAIEHDEFGKTEALTIKCGSSAVPVSYVVAEPRSIRQHLDQAGDVEEFSIVDATGRRTSVSLA